MNSLLPRPRSAVLACMPMIGIAAPIADRNIRDRIPLEKVIIQGYRGVGALAEENTVAAFELARRMGIYPDPDLRMTKDGVIVLFHDNNLARVVKDTSPELKKKGVKDPTYAEDPSVYARLLDLGVMSFATDHPDVILLELKTYYAAKPSPKNP